MRRFSGFAPAVLLLSLLLAGHVASQAPAPPFPAPTAWDPALFEHLVHPDDLAFMRAFDGRASKDLLHDKMAKKILKDQSPNITFHYGRDLGLWDAIDMVMGDSRTPILLREGRYLTLSGDQGPFLSGRAMLWVDLQEGIVLGAFYFHPTNGEPTPSVNVFSKQVSADSLSMGELPPAFAEDLIGWSLADRVPLVTTRYFLTGNKRKILLEHDEDFCSPAYGMMAGPAAPMQPECEKWIADAADIDLSAADFVDQTHHATNATAWMLSPAQVEFFATRGNLCGGVADPIGCRIRVTRERTRVVLGPRAPVRRR